MIGDNRGRQGDEEQSATPRGLLRPAGVALSGVLCHLGRAKKQEAARSLATPAAARKSHDPAFRGLAKPWISPAVDQAAGESADGHNDGGHCGRGCLANAGFRASWAWYMRMRRSTSSTSDFSSSRATSSGMSGTP